MMASLGAGLPCSPIPFPASTAAARLSFFFLLQITQTRIRAKQRPGQSRFPINKSQLNSYLNMHSTCPKCNAAVAGGSKTCSSCGSVSFPCFWSY